MKSFKEKLIINLDEINKETISDFKTEFHNLIKTFEMADFDIVLSKNIDKIDLLNCKEFLDIIRECATNSLRHAKATKLFINIKNGKKLIEIRIFDNKKIATQSLSESTGLFSIRENVKSMNGETDIKFVDGFEIRIDLPVNPDKSLN
jgi:signal transduction histidine kinase